MDFLSTSFPIPSSYYGIIKQFELRELPISGIGCFKLIDSTNNIVFSVSILGTSMAIFIRKDDTYKQQDNDVSDSNFHELFGHSHKCNDVNPLIETELIIEYISEIMSIVRNIQPNESIKDALEDVLDENDFY